ncbi:MAG: 4'-phosphopantetheinyl transferase superfamily protein [Clostridium sp.]|nr:4'-phosphopantetheinyl transferase superfamily protein [Clostridium sp.]
MNIYLMDITSVSEQDVVEYAHVLDADRQKRIAQYRRSADRRRAFGAGMALRYAWQQQYPGREMPDTARDENGRPHFVGETVSFCLSHSGNYAACALAERAENEERADGRLGLDIQEPRSVHSKIAARFFSEGEKEQLRAGTDLCLIWSRKESLAKYLGSGLRGDIRLLDTTDGEAYLWSCRTTDGYAVSVCAGERRTYRLVYLDWRTVRETVKEMRKPR